MSVNAAIACSKYPDFGVQRKFAAVSMLDMGCSPVNAERAISPSINCMEATVNDWLRWNGAENGSGTETKTTSAVRRFGVAWEADGRVVHHHAGHKKRAPLFDDRIRGKENKASAEVAPSNESGRSCFVAEPSRCRAN
jgi:hypothetical protein